MNSLGLQSEPVPSPLPLSEARRIARSSKERVKTELSKRRSQLKNSLKELRLPISLINGSRRLNLQEAVEAYQENVRNFEQARKYIEQLDQLGYTQAAICEENWPSVLEVLRTEIINTQSELQRLRDKIGVLRRQLENLGGCLTHFLKNQ
jgi:chromosome segregation ATPase